jgi:hypothetical protein
MTLVPRRMPISEDAVVYHPTGLVIDGVLPFEAWLSIGVRLRHIGKAIQWWLGDWVAYGEHTYGDKYAQALDATDYAYGSLANLAYVARRIDFSRRRENLSWSHHYEVAPLEPEAQDYWLDRAAPGPGEELPRLSTRELRLAIRGEGAPPLVYYEGPWPGPRPAWVREVAPDDRELWVVLRARR